MYIFTKISNVAC